jgi:hypothetical protein
MRKLLVVLGMIGFSILSPPAASAGGGSPALAPPNTADDLAICLSKNPNPPSTGSLGNCMALFITCVLDNKGLPTRVCGFWAASGRLAQNGYDTFAECVIGEQGLFVP